MFAIKPDGPSSIPGTQNVDGENWFLEVILCLYMHTADENVKECVRKDGRELGICGSVGRVPSTHEPLDSISSTV